MEVVGGGGGSGSAGTFRPISDVAEGDDDEPAVTGGYDSSAKLDADDDSERLL